jgi:dynein heavy chain 1
MADVVDNEAPATPVSVNDITKFVNYLRRVVPVLLEDADDAPENFTTALSERAAVECLKRFLGDPQVPVLLVQRMSMKGIA